MYESRGKRPQVAPHCCIAPTAVLIGDVRIQSGASGWFGTVLRGDMDRIEIGELRDVIGGGLVIAGVDFPWNDRAHRGAGPAHDVCRPG